MGLYSGVSYGPIIPLMALADYVGPFRGPRPNLLLKIFIDKINICKVDIDKIYKKEKNFS